MLARVAIVLCLCILSGCGGCGARKAPADAGAPAPAASGGVREVRGTVSLIDELGWCDVEHRGLLLDLGTEAMVGRYGWDLDSPRGIVGSDHDGASWARLYDRKVALRFHLPKVTPVFVSFRAIGKDTRRVTVSIDGYLVGVVKLAHGEIRTVSTRSTALAFDAGTHHVELAFGGRRGSDAEPYAEIDWVRIGTPDDLERTYGAPTLKQVLVPAAQLGGVPHRALGMHAPASVRCTVRVPPHSRLRTSVGMRGSGSGTASIAVRRDGYEPNALERVEVTGGPEAKWNDLDVSLHRFAGQVVTIELMLHDSRGTGQLLFGDPTIHVPAAPEIASPKARTVVIVVLNGVERSDLPPWRPTKTPHLPTLNHLAKTFTVFDRHRSASTLVPAAMATLLTGVSPRAHALADRGARLAASVRTMGDIARDGSVRGAMFTSVPTTFEAFGFAPHWESFTQYPPNEGKLGSQPFADAAAWLGDTAKDQAGRPELCIIHARGGHPPWDVTPPDAAKLPPDGYTGYLRPRDAAQRLAQLEGRHSRLSEADIERMRALFFAGLHAQDRALGQLITKLEDAGRWEHTLFIVTGDVASGRRTLFKDGAPLDEELLTLPLYVHFPGGAHAGERVARETELTDVLHTALLALGREPAHGVAGRDLAALAKGVEYDAQRIRVAITDDGYSARWGDYVLLGVEGKRPRLCVLAVDPLCAFDRSSIFPIATQALFRGLVRSTRRHQRTTREPLSLDSASAAMLDVWGEY